MRRDELNGKVVVITGASSGIGRAAAHAFAREGAKVVVAARRERLLHEVAQECRDLGGRALPVPVDVTSMEQVHALAHRAVEEFGVIDIWVNNAGVALFGKFHEVPMESHRRVIETNLLGYMHGARTALPIFLNQGHGVLINNASVAGEVPEPYVSAYTISKHGIVGLGLSLRQELELMGAEEVHVSTLLPAMIDTPLLQHAGNYTGRELRPLKPVYPAEQVAQAMVECALQPARERFVGAMGRALALEHKMAPRLTERMMGRTVEHQHLSDHYGVPQTDGALFQPMAHGQGVSGGWHGEERANKRRNVTRAAALVGAAGLMGAVAWWSARDGHGGSNARA